MTSYLFLTPYMFRTCLSKIPTCDKEFYFSLSGFTVFSQNPKYTIMLCVFLGCHNAHVPHQKTTSLPVLNETAKIGGTLPAVRKEANIIIKSYRGYPYTS